MSTMAFPCGCSISCSMFGDRPILDVSFCMEHVQNWRVQGVLEDLVRIMKFHILEVHDDGEIPDRQTN